MRTGGLGRAVRWIALLCVTLASVPLIVAPLPGCATEGTENEFAWELPLGFPYPMVPADNPMSAAKVGLGRRLFYDPRLSGNATLACAGCHRQERAFTDGRARAQGATGELHPRSAMSLANVAYNTTLTWADPSLDRLEDQARIPLFNLHPVEMGVHGKEAEILERLRQDSTYPLLFGLAFTDESPDADPIHFDNITRALAAFQRTLHSGNSPYDRLLYHDERGALSPQAKRGMKLFFSERLSCGECHGGFTFSGPIAYEFNGERVAVEAAFHNTGLYNLGHGAYPEKDPGLFHHTAKPEDMGRFRAPTLRNIAVTSPYMHDGSIATLEAVIDHYAAGGRSALEGQPNPLRSERIRGFVMTAEEKAALIAFLKSLTDSGFLTDPRFGPPGDESTPGDESPGYGQTPDVSLTITKTPSASRRDPTLRGDDGRLPTPARATEGSGTSTHGLMSDPLP